MANNNKTITVVSISSVIALGLGIVIGLSIKPNGSFLNKGNDKNAAFAPLKDIKWDDKPVEELHAHLSEVMLPEDEFLKLEAAIFQTAMGLFNAQAQGAGISVSEGAQQELKKSIDEKYSRKYFSDMNAQSMKDISQPELISILTFYNTDPGQKFLKLSPAIIQSTMKSVQEDLSMWLPKTVDSLVNKLKNGGKDDKNNEPDKNGLENPVKDEDKKG